MKPKKYCFKGKKHPSYGFIAQEVEKTLINHLNIPAEKYKNKGLARYDEETDSYGLIHRIAVPDGFCYSRINNQKRGNAQVINYSIKEN